MDSSLLAYLACICFIFIFGRLFISPIKMILKLLLNSAIGGIVIYVVNLIGANIGFHIGLNFINCVMLGLLGIPGAICLTAVKVLI